MINEKTRNKDGKLTRFLTGRQFVFVNTPEKPVERTAKIGGLIARLYQNELLKVDQQQTLCSRCLERGHRVSACPNNIRCGECRQEGHKRGDPVCEAVSVLGPQGSDGLQGDTGVSIAREPLTQHEPSDSEAASDDEDQTVGTAESESQHQAALGNQEDKG